MRERKRKKVGKQGLRKAKDNGNHVTADKRRGHDDDDDDGDDDDDDDGNDDDDDDDDDDGDGDNCEDLGRRG